MKINLQSRKILLTVFSVLLILVGLLSVAYAALSTTLQIIGNAEASAANWDIYLDNVILNAQSATTNVPTITDQKTATFSTTLNKPGDFYEFTIDVVNNGSIDAMIDSVTKTPELSANQAKYLNYIVEYQNGENIATKQLVAKKSFVRLKVKVEFRKDLVASDLPQELETLNFSFMVNYVQGDETSVNVKDDGVMKDPYEVISGDLDTVGSEIVIGNEHFYVMSSDETSVTMFAKYNLYVGGVYENNVWNPYGEEATGLQDPTMKAFVSFELPRNGTLQFSNSAYWPSDAGTGQYIYDSNSLLYVPIENYGNYLESKGVVVEEARLIKANELSNLGCSIISSGCNSNNSWVYSTTYWSGCSYSNGSILTIYSTGILQGNGISSQGVGVRPVIKIQK